MLHLPTSAPRVRQEGERGAGEAARQKLCDQGASGMNVAFLTPKRSLFGAKRAAAPLSLLSRGSRHTSPADARQAPNPRSRVEH